MKSRLAIGAAAAALSLASAALPVTGAGQGRPAEFDLSVRNLMRGPELVGRSPDEVRFSDDARWVYFRWRAPEAPDTATALWRVAVEGGVPEMLPDSVADREAPAPGRDGWSADGSRRAFQRLGDVYVYDRRAGERRITRTSVPERGAELSRDGSVVYYLSGSNVFAVPVDGGPLRQLTDLRTDAAPRDSVRTPQREALRRQQTELFDAVRGAQAERARREAVDSLRAEVRPLYLGRGTRVGSFSVSPSGRYLLLGVSVRPEGAQQTMVPAWVTESGYTEPLSTNAKVGDATGTERTAIVDLEAQRLTWVETDREARGASVRPVGWAPAADRALVLGLAPDFRQRWIWTAGPDASLATVDVLRDSAWIGGPGMYTAGWLSDERVYFVSERTGHAHLYAAPAAGGRAAALTSGSWEVTGVELAPDRRTFWITTSETHPGERAQYAVPAAGGARTRITALDGWTEATVSPDGAWLALLHSAADAPPELYLVRNAAGAEPRRVTESRTEEFRRGPWIRPEVVTFRARDGETVYARIYRPRDLGAAPHGGAVLFVHGAGYLQNAHRGWSTYFREYMFHHLLASEGYTVLDVDYRGSAGYGAAWRTGIHRHMGGKDLSDHVDAARWLVATEGVDPARVGIYGGSYGGFITLMALFTEAETFRSGAALRSVTDWAHYNHPYTSRILGLPQEDTLAYRRSSPIHFAEGLRGDLLIAHGMVDTNVHFQDVARLAQRLIELGKTHWELAVYPVENHAFTRPDSWADEYRRIHELFARTLLPGSPPLPNPRQ